ncbi:DUF624 domain-containing protein [Clostridium sp. MCC353]|uniref:YesL family protein n=1 Tax=Clostridium sp. MCC353 TaxID=2592646 RepID=UPI001C01F9AA|nr:YesL family protein [Clostridium sp. MCC353]MBT9779882.1 DUF624 domain-containing protein [Clostridium sp. MCC353]
MGGIFSIENPVWRFINKLLHVLLLNVLWIVCSIPLFTIGASTTAVYYVTLKLVRDEEGYTTKSFFDAFKTNFRQATVLWLILAAVGALIGADLAVYMRSSSISVFGMVLMAAFFAVAVIYLFMNIYVFALLARFDNTIRGTLKNAFLMSIRHLPSSISMIASNIILTAIGFLAFPPILLLGLPLMAFINSWFLVKIFDRYQVRE